MEHPHDTPQVVRPCLALAAAFSLLYGLLAPAHYVGGDHAIFAAAAASGGYAFPPGYPLFTMILRLGSALLPFASPIHAFDLFTGFIGAASVAALYAALRWWRVGARSSLFAAALFGLSGHALSVHSICEVFSLNDLFVAIIIGMCGVDAPLRGRARVLALGLLAGLALSHNHTCVLIAPVGLYGAWRGAREARPDSGPLAVLRAIPAGALALAAGLLPYLYLPFVSARAPGSWRWSDVRSVSDLLDTFLRRDYGSMRLTVQSGDATPLDQILFLLTEVSRDVAYLPVVVAVVGALVALHLLPELDASKEDAGTSHHDAPDHDAPELAAERAPRGPWVALAASLVLCGPLFVTLVDVDPHQGLYYLLVRKFHLLPTLLLSFFIARGADHLSGALRPQLAVGVACATVLAAGALASESVALMRTDAVDVFLRDVAAQLPPDAILLVTGDHMSGGLGYLQHGEGVRPDVAVLSAKLLSVQWYIDRMNAAHGISMTFQGTDIDLELLTRELHATGRPVLLSAPLSPELGAHLNTYPDGVLIRVLPFDQPPPSPREVLAAMDARFEAYAGTPRPGADSRSWEYLITSTYARPWSTLASAARGAGVVPLADALDARAAAWLPEPPDE